MPNAGPDGGQQPESAEEGSEPSSDCNPNPDSGSGHDPIGEEGNGGNPDISDGAPIPSMLTIVISQPEEIPNPKDGVPLGESNAGDGAPTPPVLTIVISQPEEISNPKDCIPKSAEVGDLDEKGGTAASPKKGCLSRSDSDIDQCRVCQQQTEEVLIDLGCKCRGELAVAHRSCIETWFRTRGSNKCEICQQLTANVPAPVSQQSNTYWIWRVNSTYGGINIGQGRERRCHSPLWVAFAILIGGLLLDILISVSLGVSALPVNIIIGVLVLMGLGTVIRLAVELINDRRTRRSIEGAETTSNPVVMNPGFHLAV